MINKVPHQYFGPYFHGFESFKTVLRIHNKVISKLNGGAHLVGGVRQQAAQLGAAAVGGRGERVGLAARAGRAVAHLVARQRAAVRARRRRLPAHQDRLRQHHTSHGERRWRSTQASATSRARILMKCKTCVISSSTNAIIIFSFLLFIYLFLQ